MLLSHLLLCGVLGWSAKIDAVLEWDGLTPSPVPLREMVELCDEGLKDKKVDLKRAEILHLRKSDAFFALGDEKEALDAVRKALEFNNKSLEARWKFAALIAVTPNGLKEAEEIARSILQESPDYPFGHYLMAYVAVRKGDGSLALKSSENCIRLKPDFQGAYLHKAALLGNLNQWEAALETARKGAALPRTVRTENSYAIEQALGVILLRLGRFQEAENYLVQAAQAKTEALENNIALWYCLGQNNKRQTALHVAQKLREKFPQSGEANLLLARSLLAVGDLSEAWEVARKAVTLRGDGQSIAILALVQGEKGEFLECAKGLHKALLTKGAGPDTALRASYFFATCPDPEIRHGKVAQKLLELCRNALEFPEHRLEAKIVECCALASDGQFQEAMDKLEEAARDARKFPETLKKIEKLKELYGKNHPYFHFPNDQKSQIFAPSFIKLYGPNK